MSKAKKKLHFWPVVLRYSLVGYLLLLSFIEKSVALGILVVAGILIKTFFISPGFQFKAEMIVLSQTSLKFLKQITPYNITKIITQNKSVSLLIFFYAGVMLSLINWGIPNPNHPFPYHMDEWHQLQAVANSFRYGTPNTAGSANGTMFHFVLSGLYFIPFIIFKIINPFALQIDNWFMRERVFEILRLQTIIFGVLSMVMLYKISSFINASKRITIFLFTFTPIWLALSGYFKYDIALLFWMLLSLLFFFRFIKFSNNRNFLLASIPSGLAVSVKISALPLFIIYIVSFFWFHPSWKKNSKTFWTGIFSFLSILLVFGMPDTLFGKGNISNYLYANIIESPQYTNNYLLHMNPFVYLFTHHFSLNFGYGLLVLFVSFSLIWLYIFLKREKSFMKENKSQLFIYFCLFLFIGSLFPLGIDASGNRMFVLLPFIVLLIGLHFKKLSQIPKLKLWVIGSVLLAGCVQVYQSFAWMYIKVAKPPEEIASTWIVKNIPYGETIGIENIPIYQRLPDVIQKEFYFKQYGVKQKFQYNYSIVNGNDCSAPSYIVLTNSEVESKLLITSPKKYLVKCLEKNHYRKIAIFSPNLTYFRVFGNDIDYYMSGLIVSPLTISIYKK